MPFSSRLLVEMRIMKNRHARIGIEDHGGENDSCRAMLILPVR